MSNNISPSLRKGDRAWILFARVDEASEPEAEIEPAIDTRSFSWMPVTVETVTPCGDIPGAWVTLEDGSLSWQEDRFLLSEEQARTMTLRGPYGSQSLVPPPNPLSKAEAQAEALEAFAREIAGEGGPRTDPWESEWAEGCRLKAQSIFDRLMKEAARLRAGK